MATISIENLRMRTVIGTNDWEREIKQDIFVDLSFSYDISKAVETDDFMFAIDYKATKQKVMTFVENSSFFLIEKLAQEILNILLEPQQVTKAKVILRKPDALKYCDTVSIKVKGSSIRR